MTDHPPPPKALVDPARFLDLDMRVGRVLSAQPFPEARRPALKLEVDFGAVGILWTSAQVTNYAVEELEGRMVVGAINLGSRRIAGFVSEFLVLGALSEGGDVRLLAPDEGAAPGDPVA